MVLLFRKLIYLSRTNCCCAAIIRRRTTPATATTRLMANAKLEAIDNVAIDESGRFKYILIQVTVPKDGGGETSKKIVRGHAWADYHADIYDDVCARVEPLGLDCECLGGGRIFHDIGSKKLEVYGYSVNFGAAEHKVTCDILKRVYPDYKITWSNDGY